MPKSSSGSPCAIWLLNKGKSRSADEVPFAIDMETTGPNLAGAAADVAAPVEIPLGPSRANLPFACLVTLVPLGADEIATARIASAVPAEQRTTALKSLKKADFEQEFFCMELIRDGRA